MEKFTFIYTLENEDGDDVEKQVIMTVTDEEAGRVSCLLAKFTEFLQSSAYDFVGEVNAVSDCGEYWYSSNQASV